MLAFKSSMRNKLLTTGLVVAILISPAYGYDDGDYYDLELRIGRIEDRLTGLETRLNRIDGTGAWYLPRLKNPPPIPKFHDCTTTANGSGIDPLSRLPRPGAVLCY